MSAPKIRYHLNMRAALILAAIGLTTALGLYVLWGYQEERILKIALEQVKEFQEAAEKADDRDQRSRNNDLALRHLRQFLDARPDDLRRVWTSRRSSCWKRMIPLGPPRSTSTSFASKKPSASEKRSAARRRRRSRLGARLPEWTREPMS